jgi:hypothetical protein
MLERFTGPQVMTKDHWRFRILHWSFGADFDKKEMPQFFYDHYCPLFHMTNLLVLLFPVIVLIKYTVLLCKIGINILCAIGRFLARVVVLISSLKKEKVEGVQAEQLESKPKKEKVFDEKTFAKKLNDKSSCYLDYSDFNYVYYEFPQHRKHLSKEKMEEVWLRLKTAREEQEKITAERKAKMQERMVFWVNFSQVFFKFFFNVAYGCIVALVLWLTLKYGLTCLSAVGSGISWLAVTLYGIPYLAVGMFIAKATMICAVVIIVVYLCYKFICKYGEVTILKPAKVMVTPFKIGFAILGAFCDYVASKCTALCDFIAMFYETNCPKITIVEDEE